MSLIAKTLLLSMLAEGHAAHVRSEGGIRPEPPEWKKQRNARNKRRKVEKRRGKR